MKDKKIQKRVALFLALVLVLGMFCTQVFAADGEETIHNADGTITLRRTDTDVQTDPETGNVTTVVTVVDHTTGTNHDGVLVDENETTITTTVRDKDGNVISETQEGFGDGERSWQGAGDGNGPAVTVSVNPGEPISDTENHTAAPVTDTKDEDGRYETTQTTTTTERTVDVVAYSMDAAQAEGTYPGAETQPTVSIAPENYAAKRYNDPNSNQQTGLLRGYSPTSLIPDAQASGIARPEQTGYDYWYAGVGDMTNAVKVRNYMFSYRLDANGNPIPKLDADGNPLYHADGSPQFELSSVLSGGNKDGFDKTTSQFALTNVNNDMQYFAYCVDNDTPTTPGAWYRVTNLENCDYFPSEDSANHIRGIVNHGYWGTASGTGSLSQIISQMKAYYGDQSITVAIDDKGNTVTRRVVDVIDGLTESEALAVTQGAIWSYANGSVNVQDGQPGRVVKDIVPVYQPRLPSSSRYYRKGTYSTDTVDEATIQSNVRIQAMYDWLTTMTEPAPSQQTVVLDEKNFLVDNSTRITVGERLMTAEENPNGSNAVYSVDLTFSLSAKPSTANGDDLVVKLLDESGKLICQARLAGSGQDDGEDFAVLTVNADNSYTLQDIPMEENSALTFCLQVEGTQNVGRGVYVYTAPNEDETNTFQTLVGIAQGTQHVAVSSTMTFAFRTNEISQHHSVSTWRWSRGPEDDPPEAGGDDFGGEGDNGSQTGNNNGNNGQGGDNDVPGTGDTLSVGQWVLVMLTGAFAAAAVSKRKKQKD